MAKYASNDQKNFKIGISSFSDNKTSLEVIGRVGINSTTAQNELDVAGSVNITDGLSVGGLSTFTGVGTFVSDLYVGGDLYVADDIVLDEVTARNVNISGVTTLATLGVTGLATTKDLTVFGNTQTVGVTTLSSDGGITTTGGDFFIGGNFFLEDLKIGSQGIDAVNLSVSGIATITTLEVTGLTTTKDLLVTGLTTTKDLLVTGITTLTGIVTTGSDLYIENDLYVKGNSNLNDTLVSGALTATTFTGAGTGLTGITSATNATNIYGGLGGQLLYQAQPGITSAFEYGSTNFALVSRGLNNPPQWAPAAPSGAIEGILLFDEGTQVGAGVTYAGIDFRGQEVLIEGAPLGGIATVYVSRQPYVEQAGVSTSVVGGAASVTSLNVTGITTLNTVNANSLNVDVGISSFADFKITSSGVGATVGASAGITTYYGRGIELTGIVTTITAGPNISINQSTGNVTITGMADTSILVADSLFVTGITTLNTVTASSLIVSGITTLGVVTGATYYGNGNNLTGIVTSLVAGDNISLSDSQGEVTITGIAKTDRITAESLVVTGVSTFQGQVNADVVTATSYSGNGINLTGIVTTITAGPNIAINQSTGNVTITGIADTSVITADNLFVAGVSTFQGQVTAGDVNSSGVVTATSFSGSGTNLSGIVTSLIAGPNISLSGSTGEVTITGLANTANVKANTLVVSGVSTLGIVTGAESIGVVTVYANNFVGGDFTGGNATFSGNVAIGGSLTYEDVSSIDTVCFITAREGINVGVVPQTGVGVTFLANGSGVFSGIVTVSGDLNVGSASSQFTVQQTATTVEVGIGTIDPNYNLDVRGTANIEGKLSVGGNTVPSLAMVIALGGF